MLALLIFSSCSLSVGFKVTSIRQNYSDGTFAFTFYRTQGNNSTLVNKVYSIDIPVKKGEAWRSWTLRSNESFFTLDAENYGVYWDIDFENSFLTKTWKLYITASQLQTYSIFYSSQAFSGDDGSSGSTYLLEIDYYSPLINASASRVAANSISVNQAISNFARLKE
jgi:hypothetical protein